MGHRMRVQAAYEKQNSAPCLECSILCLNLLLILKVKFFEMLCLNLHAPLPIISAPVLFRLGISLSSCSFFLASLRLLSTWPALPFLTTLVESVLEPGFEMSALSNLTCPGSTKQMDTEQNLILSSFQYFTRVLKFEILSQN